VKNRCTNPVGRNDLCGKSIPEDDIESVKTDSGLVCGACIDAMFSKSDDPLDTLGRPKQGKATRQSAYCGTLASTKTASRD